MMMAISEQRRRQKDVEEKGRAMVHAWLPPAEDGTPSAIAGHIAALFAADSPVRTARQWADRMGLGVSTMASRFCRAGVPTMNDYVARARLVKLAALMRDPRVSLARAAMEMDYSSAQHLGRHIKAMTGEPSVLWRMGLTPERELGWYRDWLLKPYIDELQSIAVPPAKPKIGRPRTKR